MKNVTLYFKSVRAELAKVTWPGYREFIGSTIIVLILVVLFAIYLGALDFCFQWAARQIFAGNFSLLG
jgi:preprotein translocase subunit SecE